MVNMNEPLSNCAVSLLKIESAGEATTSLNFDTGCAVGVVPLITVHKNPNTASLGKTLRIQIGQLLDFLQRDERKDETREPFSPCEQLTVVLIVIFRVSSLL